MADRSAPATLTVSGRLFATRFVGVALVLVLAGFVFGAMTIGVAVQLRTVSVPGVSFDGTQVATSTVPGVVKGDELVAVADVRASPLRIPSLLTEVPAPPGPTTVTIATATGLRDVPAVTGPLPELHTVGLWIRVVCGVLGFLLGVTSFILAPGSRAAWLFLIFCLNLEVTLLFNVCFIADDALFIATEPIIFALGGTLGLHLFSEMPTRRPIVVRHPWLIAAAYAPAVAVAVMTAIVPVANEGPRLLGPLWSLIAGVGSFTLLWRGFRQARADADEPQVSRYRTLLIGLSVGLFLPALVHTFRQVSGIGGEKWVIHLNAAPVLFYAACTAWALLRQNVLRADETTAIVVSYVATLLTLGLGCGCVLVGLPLVLEGRVVRTPAALAAVTAAAALAVVPLYRRLKAAIDRRFQRDRASDEKITAVMNDVMRAALEAEPEEAIDRAVEALATMAPDRAELWLREGGAGDFLRRGDASGTAAVAGRGPLEHALAGRSAGGVEGLAPFPFETEAQRVLWDQGLAMAAPVLVAGELRGFVAVGRRAGATRYRAAEQGFLSLVASQIGLALERAADQSALGKYRLERRLGTGGMAEVYLARQRGLGGFERRVAIKRPLPHAAEDPAFLSMFIDEAKLAAHLHHPNIVETYEVDRVGSTTFIAMEFVDGDSLRTLLRATRATGIPVPVSVVLALMDALLRALAYAHAAVDGNGARLGIVHRDVSPGNLLVANDGRVKLADFGVARSTARLQVTQTGVVKGTLAYMAPEQASAGAVDTRSDLFAAGAILCECLSGSPPYPSGPPVQPAPPRPVDAPRALHAVIERALAWNPADRYADAEAMRHALLEACAPMLPASADEVAAWARDVRAARAEHDALPEAVTAVDVRSE